MSSQPVQLVLGVAGGSGSGKSSLVERLVQSEIGPSVGWLSQDAYYLGQQMPSDLRAAKNFDHPDCIEWELLVQHVQSLLNGHTVQQPVYDFANHSRTDQTKTIFPTPILVVEGTLVLAVSELVPLMDLRVFVDTPGEERIVRRILRDVRQRQRTVESVIEQFRSSVRPMFDRFVAPSRSEAHLVIPWDWNHDFQPAIATILSRLRDVC